MNPTRREVLALGAGVVFAGCIRAAEPKKRLGVVIHSYGIRRGHPPRADGPRFDDPCDFLDYCASLGAAGVQTRLAVREPGYAAKLRAKAEKYGMFVEGTVNLPQDDTEAARFEAELLFARDCGVAILRTVAMGERRYEKFETKAAFDAFQKQAWKSLQLAEPLVRKMGLRLAVENHKDWRIDELVGVMKKLSSEHVGVCLDTGNSISLLEEPMVVVKAYAPWTITTHLKDMAVAEYDEGFLLAEIPFGEGFLDLKEIVTLVDKARPHVRWNLEMITRDPLRVPCLTPKYWATLEAIPGRRLADMLALVRKKQPTVALPIVSKMSVAEQIEVEEVNVRKCFKFAREKLEL